MSEPPGKPKRPAAPREMGATGERVWRQIWAGLPADMVLDEREMLILREACGVADDIARLDGLLKAAKDPQATLRVLSERRQQRLAFGRLLAQLELSGEPAKTPLQRRASQAAKARWRPITRLSRGARLARKARTPVAAEEERARSVSEVEALATRLPVTGGLPEDAVPVDVQIAIRDEARDVLTRGAATPQEADRLWERLPSYWRRQWRPQFLGDRADVRRMRAIRSSRVVIAASARRTGESPAGEDAQAPTLTALPAAAALPPFVRGGTAPPIQASLP